MSTVTTDAPLRLAVRELSAGYPERTVIEGLDLEFAPGRMTMVIGANACGKSTLLGVLARVLPPLGGVVELDGTDVAGIPRRAFAQRVGLLPQHPTAPDGLTVAELVSRGRHPLTQTPLVIPVPGGAHAAPDAG